MDFTRRQQVGPVRGINLRLPADKLPEDQWPVLQNVRSYLLGTIEGRPGLTAINTALATSPLHSITRLNDDTLSATQPFTYVVGSGTAVYTGVTPSGAAVVTGLSGDPVSLVSYRPDQAVSPWIYIADSLKMAKVNVGGTARTWGIQPPLVAPTAALGAPVVQIVDNFGAVGSWVPFGGGGAIGVTNRIPAQAIASILYDTGNTGWCCLEPTTFSDAFQAGMLLTLTGATEACRVQLVRRKIPSTTIGSIAYDSGSSGLCSIQPVNLITDVGVTRSNDLLDSMIRLNAAENVRILSVTIGQNGQYSLRCSTSGTFSAGQAIDGKDAVRVYTVSNHTTGDNVSADSLQTVVTAPGTVPFQAGIKEIGLAKNLLNATNVSTAATRPLQPSDEIHLSIRIDGLSKVQEGRILFDVDKSTTDFSSNYFFWAFRQPDIASALQETFTAGGAPATVSSVLPTVVTRSQYDASAQKIAQDFNGGYNTGNADTASVPTVPTPTDATDPGNVPVSNQTGFGELQWLELRFKFADLTRVGTDLSRTMANVGGIQIQLTLTAGVSLMVDGLWVGGSYGADLGSIGAPYIYKYRGRDSITGARSLCSPPMRAGVQPRRDLVSVTGTQHVNAAVDLIDWYRFGGNLTRWRLVGTTPNSATPTFNDECDDIIVEGNEPEDTTAYQPFPTVAAPKNSVVNVAGTSVAWVSGDTFNTAWAPGSIVTIGGLNYTLYSQPASTTKLQIVQNGGTQASAAMVIPEATVLGQPMATVWGDFQGFFFACGDVNQPGVLFWTNRFTPDTANENNQLEVTDPSDTLMNGVMLNGWPFVWSQTNIYRITPDYSSPSVFQSQTAVPGSGLYAPWFLCEAGNMAAYGDRDGIYLYDGFGTPVSITDAELYPLFPHDGQVGIPVNGFYPPDYTQTSALRLSSAYGQIFFDYLDTLGARRTLMYDMSTKSWWPDAYSEIGVVTHYVEAGTAAKKLLAGGTNGILYQVAGTSDGPFPIAGVARTRSDNAGDVRMDKLFGDGMLDVDQRNVVISTQIGFDKFSIVDTLASQPVATGEVQLVLGINGGLGVTARDVALEVKWSSSTASPRLYAWGYGVVPKVEITTSRATDWEDAGTKGAKYVQGILLRADTLSATKLVQIQYDGGTVGATLSIQDTGERLVPYAFPTPILAAHLLRLAPADSVPWRIYEFQWIFEPAPEPGIVWNPQGTTFDLDGFKHLFLAGISYVSTTPCTLSLNVDGVLRSQTYTLPSTSGLHVKSYVQIEPVKGKLFQPILTAAQPCQVFAKDCEFWVGPWASNAPYSIQKPFGGPSRATGAQI